MNLNKYRHIRRACPQIARACPQPIIVNSFNNGSNINDGEAIAGFLECIRMKDAQTAKLVEMIIRKKDEQIADLMEIIKNLSKRSK